MAYINLQELSKEAWEHIAKKEWDKAENKVSYLLDIHPNEVIFLYYWGCILFNQKKYGMAIAAYERALQLDPTFDECLNNASNAYRLIGDIETCKKYFAKAIEIAEKPDYLEKVKSEEQRAANLNDYYGNLGSCYIASGQPKVALEYFEKANKWIKDTPNVKWNQGLALLELGEYEKGFEGYDFGDRVGEGKERSYHGAPNSTPRWIPQKNQEPKPTVVVYGEQGIGDEIMFASILEDAMQDADIILECHPRLIELFRQSFPNLPVYGTRKATQVAWLSRHKVDAKIAIGSLARYYRKKVEDFPRKPYLVANEDLKQKMYEKLRALGIKPKIGISWKGGIGITNKKPRCIELELLKPLWDLNADFISLQYHVNALAEIDKFTEQTGGQYPIIHWQDVVDDYDMTAAMLTQLDLVISVPQSVVHLAGALGVPTIQMCPVRALWQMGVYKHDMPWYESVINFWQPSDGDWINVVKNVVNHLKIEGKFNAHN